MIPVRFVVMDCTSGPHGMSAILVAAASGKPAHQYPLDWEEVGSTSLAALRAVETAFEKLGASNLHRYAVEVQTDSDYLIGMLGPATWHAKINKEEVEYLREMVKRCGSFVIGRPGRPAGQNTSPNPPRTSPHHPTNQAHQVMVGRLNGMVKSLVSLGDPDKLTEAVMALSAIVNRQPSPSDEPDLHCNHYGQSDEDGPFTD